MQYEIPQIKNKKKTASAPGNRIRLADCFVLQAEAKNLEDAMKKAQKNDIFILRELCGYTGNDDIPHSEVMTDNGKIEISPEAYSYLRGCSAQGGILNPIGKKWEMIEKTSRINGRIYLTVQEAK